MSFSPTYGYTRTFANTSHDEAYDRVVEALKEEGFGVLTEIDVKSTLKAKLGVDFRPYTILGACNPPLAHKALTSELALGLLLPCNVVVTEDEEGNAIVSIVNPREMFKVVDNDELMSIAGEVDARVQRVLESL